MIVEGVPNDMSDVASQFDILGQDRPAEVEISIA